MMQFIYLNLCSDSARLAACLHQASTASCGTDCAPEWEHTAEDDLLYGPSGSPFVDHLAWHQWLKLQESAFNTQVVAS